MHAANMHTNGASSTVIAKVKLALIFFAELGSWYD